MEGDALRVSAVATRCVIEHSVILSCIFLLIFESQQT